MNNPETLEVISVLTQRLQILRVQEANFGSAQVPTHIVLQIREAEQQLAERIHQRTQLMFDAQDIDVSPPSLARGLITAVSMLYDPQSLQGQAAFQAIAYHRRTLRHCWLIASSGKNTQSSEPTAQKLKDHFAFYDLPCSIYLIENGSDLLETQQLMHKIFEDIARSGQFASHEVICDITSGTKAMTAGMVLVCGTQHPMQYMLATKPNAPSLPVLLHVDR